MNKFKFYFIVLITTITVFSCSKNDDSVSTEPLRDYQTQYDTDIKDIEEYLKTNYIEVINAPGQTTDQDVTISKLIPGKTSIWDQKEYKLINKIVKQDGIEYTLYYLILREGTGQSPCNVDNVLTSYKGTYISRSSETATPPSVLSTTQFDEMILPQTFFQLFTTEAIPLRGWSEVFPQFKTGTYTANSNGTINYKDFGAGVMFLPSGLGYYNAGASTIPAYAPLIFSFKLYEIQRTDQDNDGIPSYLEDLNGDGYMRILGTGVDNPDDFDKDGIPDFLDVDDDGDGFTTRLEITKPGGSNLDLDGPSTLYPFDPIISNPAKETDEKRGIPAYSATGTPDYTSPKRIRIHQDKDHHTAKP